MPKTAMLIELRNGKKYLAKPKSVNPVVYLSTHEFLGETTFVSINEDDPEEIDEDKNPEPKKVAMKPQRDEIINQFIWFYFITVNGSEIYKRTDEIEGWYLVKYEVGLECYFVTALSPKSKANDSLHRDNVNFHI